MINIVECNIYRIVYLVIVINEKGYHLISFVV